MTQRGSYLQGQAPILAAAFSTTLKPMHQIVEVSINQMDLEYDGELFDPAVVQLIVHDAADTLTTSIYGVVGQTYPIVRDQAGVYYAKVLLDHAGRWRYRWEGDPGTDVAKISDEVDLDVRPTRIS